MYRKSWDIRKWKFLSVFFVFCCGYVVYFVVYLKFYLFDFVLFLFGDSLEFLFRF